MTNGPEYPHTWTYDTAAATPPGGGGNLARVLAIVGAVVVGLLVLTTVVVLTLRATSGSGSDRAASSSSASASALIEVEPAAILPSTEEISTATLQAMKPATEVYTRPTSESDTDPVACRTVITPQSESGWGAATSVAWRFYTTGTYTSYTAAATVGAAVFATADDARRAMAAAEQAVRSCPSFTLKAQSTGIWNASVTTASGVTGRVDWRATPTSGVLPWNCLKSLRVERNMMTMGNLCSRNPGDTAAVALADLIAAKGTAGR